MDYTIGAAPEEVLERAELYFLCDFPFAGYVTRPTPTTVQFVATENETWWMLKAIALTLLTGGLYFLYFLITFRVGHSDTASVVAVRNAHGPGTYFIVSGTRKGYVRHLRRWAETPSTPLDVDPESAA